MRIDFAGMCFSDAPGAHFTHSPAYVVLSFVIAAVGSYTALDLVEWLRRHPTGTSWFWHLAASATLGGSIWAMHFTGMLAVETDPPMSFDPWLTVLSMMLGILGVAVSLQIALSGHRSGARLVMAGMVLGFGVATMHYVGMAALRLSGTVTYTPGLCAASILIAMGAAVVGLWLSLTTGRKWHRLPATAIMAAAICGMHYTGMAASVIHLDPSIAMPVGVAPGPLAAAVAGTTLALLLLALVSVTADRRLSDASAREAEALRHVNAELRMTQHEIVARLCTAGEFRDNETGAHVIRMAQIAYRLALAVGCDAEFAERLLTAAPLHDIGKIGIADAILLKPGALSPLEREIMQEHTILGARILGGSELPMLKLAAEIAQSHHEKWDGSGYPHGLKNTAIPLASRIVAVADVLDALLSKRPYKRAWSVSRVMDHMQEQAGKHFDPRVVDALLAHWAQILETWHEYARLGCSDREVVPADVNRQRNRPIARVPDATSRDAALALSESLSFAAG